MILNLIVGLVVIFIGSWLAFVSQFSYSSSVAFEAIAKHVNFDIPHNEQIFLVNRAYLILLVVGILTIIVGFVLLWNAIDIFFLITNVGKNAPVIRDYKKQVKEEMTSAAEEISPENWKNINVWEPLVSPVYDCFENEIYWWLLPTFCTQF